MTAKAEPLAPDTGHPARETMTGRAAPESGSTHERSEGMDDERDPKKAVLFTETELRAIVRSELRQARGLKTVAEIQAGWKSRDEMEPGWREREEPEGVAKAQRAPIVRTVRRKHNRQRPLVPQGNPLEQRRGCTGVGLLRRPEDRLQEIAGGRRCQNPDAVRLRRNRHGDRVARHHRRGSRLQPGAAPPRRRAAAGTLTVGKWAKSSEPRSVTPALSRARYAAWCSRWSARPSSLCWCLRFASATMTLRDSSRHQPGQYSWPRSRVRQNRQELLAAGAREELVIDHDLERADFLRWLSFSGEAASRRRDLARQGRPGLAAPGLRPIGRVPLPRNPPPSGLRNFRRSISRPQITRIGVAGHIEDAEPHRRGAPRAVAASLSTFGQHSGDYVSRVKQDCSVLLCRELDEAQSPEQEHSFDGQQSMTNVLGVARLRQERIEQRAVVAPRWLHHVGGVHQRG